jgi:imidazolonepropionase-like amidohydrolase
MILCLLAALLTTRPEPKPLAIVGATLIDGTGAPPVSDSAILIRGGRIVAAGPRSQVSIPPDATEVDASGKWIIPGLIDLHVHLDEDITPYAYPIFGVTSVRDVGSRLVTLQKLRARAAKGETMPRFFWTGRNIDEGKPSWWGAVAVKGPKQAPALLDGMAKQRVDGVKLYVAAGPKVSRAVIEDAHRRGWPVTGHVEATPPSQAAAMGIDNLEHVSTLLAELRKRPSAKITGFRKGFANVAEVDLDTPKAKRLIANLKAHHVAVTATLSVSKLPVDAESEALRAYSGWAGLPQAWRKEWKRSYWSFISTKGWSAKDYRFARNAYSKLAEMVARLHKAGVDIVAGTDTPAPWVLPGAGLLRELELLVEAGLTPMDAIRAATGKAAKVLRKEKEVGALLPGRRADLMLLGADPLIDIRNVRRIDAVYLGGDKLDLHQLRERFHGKTR